MPGAAGLAASCSENPLAAWVPGLTAGGSAPRQPRQCLFSLSSWHLLRGEEPGNCECSWRGGLPAASAGAGEAGLRSARRPAASPTPPPVPARRPGLHAPAPSARAASPSSACLHLAGFQAFPGDGIPRVFPGWVPSSACDWQRGCLKVKGNPRQAGVYAGHHPRAISLLRQTQLTSGRIIWHPLEFPQPYFQMFFEISRTDRNSMYPSARATPSRLASSSTDSFIETEAQARGSLLLTLSWRLWPLASGALPRPC